VYVRTLLHHDGLTTGQGFYLVLQELATMVGFSNP
jgi:hypothetical protein